MMVNNKLKIGDIVKVQSYKNYEFVPSDIVRISKIDGNDIYCEPLNEFKKSTSNLFSFYDGGFDCGKYRKKISDNDKCEKITLEEARNLRVIAINNFISRKKKEILDLEKIIFDESLELRVALEV